MKDLAERIVLALEDFGKYRSAITEDGVEIERLYYIYNPDVGIREGARRAKIEFVISVLTEKIKPFDAE